VNSGDGKEPMELDIEAMRRRLEAASPGPWSHHGADVRGPEALIFTGRDGSSELRRQADRDAEFVAKVRADFAALLDFVAGTSRRTEPQSEVPTADPTPAGPRHRRPD
jgi:hypothetical protein